MPEMKPPKIGDGKAKTGNPATKQSFANAIDSILKDDPMKIKSGFFFFEKIRTKEEFQEAFDFVINNLNNKKYQPYLGKILDVIGQNGQVLGPTKWFSGMETIFSEPCPPDIREYALSSSNYLLSFYSNFGEELVKNISIENIKDYNKTGKYLKFIFYLSKYSQGWQFSEHLTEEIKDKLSQFTDNNPENNYLLSKFSQGILDGVDNKNHPRSRDLPFFKINSQNQYGAVYEDGFLHVSDPMDSEEIKSKIESIRELELLIGKVDIRQLQSEAIKLKDSIEDLVAKNTIKPDDLDTVSIKQNKEQLNELYKNYLFLLDGIMRPIIEEDFGDAIFTMPIKEQLHFLSYAKDLKVKEIAPIKKFAKDYGVTGFRTFLSLEHGGKEMGDKILQLGEKLPKETAEKLFTKYSEIIDKVDNLVGALEEKLKNSEKINANSEIAVKENLLIRAKNLLKKYTDNANKNPESILRELEGVNSDNILLLSIFQSLHSSDGIKFEDVKDFSFINEWSGSEFLTQKELLEMENIIDKNYKDAPSAVLKAVKNSFLESTHNFHGYYNDVEIPQLKFKDKVVAFCRLDYSVYENTDDYGKKVYFGSFNVDPDFANGEIGNAMLERTVDRVAKNHVVEADCNAFSKIGAKYIESGFYASNYYDFNGWPSFKIVRDDTKKSLIIGKNLSKEEIILQSSAGLIEKNGKTAMIFSAKNPESLSEVFQNIKSENKIVSRYFYDNDSKSWFIVIESANLLEESL